MRTAIVSLLLVGAVLNMAAQQPSGPIRQSPATLDASEALFALFSAINNCGYNDELNVSLPLRTQVRQELTAILQQNPRAAAAQREVCAFYRDHMQADTALTISQYVSLGLLMNSPPQFTTRVKEADLPPDASFALGILSPLERMYEAANLHGIWLKHKSDYDALLEQYHEPLRKMISTTDLYLRLPVSGSTARGFVIYLEPLIGPSLTNSRNYNIEYYFVASPDGENLKIDKIRHTYLHFLLDNLTQKRANQLRRIEPLLNTVKAAPMDNSFKTDMSLLTIESLIQAVEVRLTPIGKDEELKHEQAVQNAMAQGYILTKYFYDQLKVFETSETGLELSFGEWLRQINVDSERKRATEVQFASSSTPEIVTISRPQSSLLMQAEQSMLKGDLDAAADLANQVLGGSKEDHGKAYFVLARVSVLRAVGDVESKEKGITQAKEYLYKGLERATDARTKAWCHIYLGRIFDIQDDRENALRHYNAALVQGDPKPDTEAAAERGMKAPYKIPTRPEQSR